MFNSWTMVSGGEALLKASGKKSLYQKANSWREAGEERGKKIKNGKGLFYKTRSSAGNLKVKLTFRSWLSDFRLT
ncbi:hypothetical protein DXT99_25270 [Pontibacter diazotrophicus]|uniref:Uncharacterized protein n=1 Tax=Pontibacter diazotrophicus TaxID=1400979 RepID=A0A3D8L1Q5_9BACT|nr:hypothetical protein DXT99_25270 [Pontibacter diazotrophicus]